MTTVFLDTNVIINEGFLKSTWAEAILKNENVFDIKILIPEVVIDEAKRNFASKLQKKITKYKESRKDLNRFTNLPDVPLSLDNVIDDYNKFLDNLLDEGEITILPYPETSLKELVEKSYEAKKPFKDTGKGFKDYTIWQTIKNYCKDNNNSVKKIFITNDKDFNKEQDNGTFILHPDLADSLEGIKEIPELMRSLKDFFNQELKPLLSNLDSNDIPNFNIYKKIKTILENDLPDYSVNSLVGLSFDEDLDIMSVTNGPEIFYLDISEINEDDILIDVEGNVEIEVQGSMSAEQFYGEDNDDADYVDDTYWMDDEGIMINHSVVVSQCIEISFELSIAYSKKDKEITNSTINLS